MASVQNKLTGAPAVDSWKSRQLRQLRSIVASRSRKREVRFERPLLPCQSRGPAHRIDVSRQRGTLIQPFAKAQPNDSREPAPLEGAELTQLDVEARGDLSREMIGDQFDQPPVDATHKPEREVKVVDWHPAEPRRDRDTLRDESRQNRPLRRRQRQPEKRP